MWLECALASCGWIPTRVLCGTARGADMLGAQWAITNRVPITYYPADWHPGGGPLDRSAGHKRNAVMAEQGEALIALWDGTSPGTRWTIELARKRGLRVFVQYVM
jgi:hypothetical protein